MQMITIREELCGLEVGSPTRFENLTIFPLFRPGSAEPDPGYILLEDAIAQGSARVSEVNAGGVVPELTFENAGSKPVLLLDGEELVGAKQNRVLNLSILVAAGATIKIPVSCVEAGRWDMRSQNFAPADAVQYAKARAARTIQVSRSIRESGSRRSDQHEIWADIAEKCSRLKTESPTGAMRAMYEKHRDTVEHYLRAFACDSRQSGMLYCIGNRVWGIDLLDHPGPMGRIFPKLLRGYALDAIDTQTTGTRMAAADEAGKFVAAVMDSPTFAEPAIGLGKDVRIGSAAASGAALWAEERYIHLCAFSNEPGADAPAPQTGISRPSRRRG